MELGKKTHECFFCYSQRISTDTCNQNIQITIAQNITHVKLDAYWGRMHTLQLLFLFSQDMFDLWFVHVYTQPFFPTESLSSSKSRHAKVQEWCPRCNNGTAIACTRDCINPTKPEEARKGSKKQGTRVLEDFKSRMHQSIGRFSSQVMDLEEACYPALIWSKSSSGFYSCIADNEPFWNTP